MEKLSKKEIDGFRKRLQECAPWGIFLPTCGTHDLAYDVLARLPALLDAAEEGLSGKTTKAKP